ncbi:MAG TPA: PQQ-binding-like beta-propeller repeat protein [Nitrososphaera sp.]|jgi:outer membrane protein assembly factor BamB
MHYRLLFAVIAGLLVVVVGVPGAFAQSGPAFSTYQAWEFGALGNALAASTIGDLSGDSVDDLVVASESRSIYLVDGMSGEQVWSYSNANRTYLWRAVMESPDANGDGLPDVLGMTYDAIVVMLDGSTGEELWSFRTSNSSGSSSNGNNPCSPLARSMHVLSDIDGGGVRDIALVTGSGDRCVQNDKIAVIALSAEDGSKIWEYLYEAEGHGLKDGNRGSSPAVAVDFDGDGSEDVAVIDAQNVIHMIDGRTGNALGRDELDDVFGVIWNLILMPDISGDGVEDAIALEFIDGGGGPDYASVNAIDLAEAEVIWQAKAGDGLFFGGAVYSAAWLPIGDDLTYVAVTQRVENYLHLAVLNAHTGEQAWRFDLGEERSRNDIEKYYPVARVPDLSESRHDEIAVGDIGSRLYLLDGMNANVIWSYPINEQISDIMSIELQGGQAYVIVEDRDKRIHALAGLTQIETVLEISTSDQTLALTPLPDRITVVGSLTPALRGEVVELRYVDPTGKVTTVPLVVARDGSFSHVLEPQIAGTWKVTAQFDGEGHYLDSKSSTISFTVTEQEPGSSIYMLEVEGSEVSYPISYRIEGGHITGMSVDRESKSLNIAISATQDGTLTIKLPRNVVDAFDSSYLVHVDGDPADFEETEAETGFRTLVIPFSARAEEVQVSGTYVVPEFPVATVMMAIAIAGSIVAVAAYGSRRLKVFSH